MTKFFVTLSKAHILRDLVEQKWVLLFLNLPLWANFYIYTDLSGTTTTRPLEQPTLLDDLNLNPQPG